MLNRIEYIKLWEKLSNDKSMILISGPRQSGKTTLSRHIQKTRQNSEYFNWDIISNKQKIINDPTFFTSINRTDTSKPLVIFDEIHKYKNWKNYLKGIYDEFYLEYDFIITGSGRLDLFSKGGDSLAGRYFMFNLFPFTLSELSPNKVSDLSDLKSDFILNDQKQTGIIWQQLKNTGGFPEPFTKGTQEFFNNWSQTYITQIIREDINSISHIKNISTLELLYSCLPSKIGNPFSLNSMSKDLQVSFDTVKNWLMLLETVFLIFKISPWTQKISRAILKEKKYYMYNYAEIPTESAKFENMIALELLRAITLKNNAGLGRYSLHYVRNKDGQEVDFLITDKNNPVLLIEAKLNATAPADSLLKIQSQLNVPAIQLVEKDNVFIKKENNNQPLVISTAKNWLASI